MDNLSNQPLVSVVIPNYNYARFLEKRIQSILNQTYPNIDVIILDDCSSDDSIEIINKYKDDARIREIVINKINSGSPSIQWAKGIKMAKGELIWIAEADDFCEKNFLEELVSIYQKNSECSFVFTRSVFVDDNDIIIPQNRIRKKGTQVVTGKNYLKNYLFSGCDPQNASSVIFSKAKAMLIVDTGRWKSLPTANDYMFWVEMAQYGKVGILNKPLNYFRKHANELTTFHNMNGNNYFAEKKVFEEIESKVHISKIRKRIAYAIRRRIILSSPISKETKTKLIDCWTPSVKLSIFDKYLLKAYYTLCSHV